MKKIVVLFMALVSAFALSACEKNNTSTVNAADNNRPEKIHDDIAAEKIDYVTISGNAKSIVLRQSANEYFAFYNADLKPAHTYEVHCDEKADAIDIQVIMENAKGDNDVLGSVVIDIPQKEFENIEVTGDFGQISLSTMNSDVFINASKSFVYLDLEADLLKHNITLDNSEANAFSGVSLYLDQFPDNVKMDFNLIQDGTINDPQNILNGNGLEAGSGEPIIRINNTNVINIYSKE